MAYSFSVVIMTLLLLTGCAHQLPIKPSPESDPVHFDQTDSTPIPDPLEQGVQIGRYTVVSATPTAAQDNILSIIVTINFLSIGRLRNTNRLNRVYGLKCHHHLHDITGDIRIGTNYR